MAFMRDDFDRILTHGGVFIIFAAPSLSQELVIGYSQKYHGGLQVTSDLDLDLWCFLTATERDLAITGEAGEEMECDLEDQISRILRHYLDESEFACTIRARIKEKFFA